MESLYSLVEEIFDEVLLEVSSEKQRRWACAQTKDDFEGDPELTRKQAKEMCTSEIDEGLKDFVKSIGQKAGAMLSGIDKTGKNVDSLINALGINYLDPNSQTREILDTAEILHDIHRFGASRALSDPYDKQLFDRWIQAKASAKKKARETDWKTTGFLEEEELTETSAAGAGAIAGSPGNNKGPWPGLEKEKDREDLTIANR